jgi:hypothetical protein
MDCLKRPLRTLSLLALAGVVWIGALGPREAHAAVNENQAKAAALYQFAHFTTWPPEAFADKESPLIIGVWGREPLETLLDALVRGETSQGRAILVKHCFTAADAENTHILFVSRSEMNAFARDTRSMAARPVLTVSDTESFAQRGGIVQLEIRDQRIHIVVNLAAAKRANVVLSAKLLKLAEIIPVKEEE